MNDNKYVPDYDSVCVNCDSSPVVTVINSIGKLIFTTKMCGPCTFGSATYLDSSLWNELWG